MIPKIIHYCWFGGKNKPDIVLSYLKTWHSQLSDYIIKEWNETNFNISEYKYTEEAYKYKKYAFVSDVCRLEVLYKYGGIYLDTDIEVIRSFDSFLKAKTFLGFERKNIIGTGVIGCEPGQLWVKEFLHLYKDISFVSNGKLNLKANTFRLTDFFENHKIYKPYIYPIDFFCAKDWKTGKVKITDNTICIHHYAGTWLQKTPIERFEEQFWKFLKIKNLNLVNKVKWTWIRISNKKYRKKFNR